MLYVNNQDEALNFWTEKVGFHVVAEEDNNQGMRWIEIAPTKDAETSIILHNKEVIFKNEPRIKSWYTILNAFSQKILNNYTKI